MNGSTLPPRAPRWALVGLLLILGFDVAWRWHTIGPTPLSRPFEGTIIRSGETEPLDCDEAAYAYMGRRVLRGDVLYRDLTENKPPLGYWLYTLAVASGGANEQTIRLMAIPYVLGTLGLVWWVALRLAGPGAACLAAAVFAVADTDPYVFGNGSNMEHFLNLFSGAALALMVAHLGHPRRAFVVGAGVCIGLASLVKQVAAVEGIACAAILLWPGRSERRARTADLARLAAGAALPWLVASCVLVAQGAGWAAYDDIVRFAAAMARDIPTPPGAPPWFLRPLTGNADPQGRLPWPFGRTDYLVWWGAGLWPFWIAGVPATARLLLVRPADRGRVLLGAWTVASWAQVILPGQSWQHYYLLAVPGTVLAVAVWAADLARAARLRPARSIVMGLGLAAALGWSGWIQVRDYLGATPDEITSRYKGGRQWVALRALGEELAGRTKGWDDPRLFVWGWQSPLFLYSGLDAPGRHFFANALLEAKADSEHPLVKPWIGEIMADLKARPPAIILAGAVPFRALRAFLNERYLPSTLDRIAPDGRGLWVEKGLYGAFHSAGRGVRP